MAHFAARSHWHGSSRLNPGWRFAGPANQAVRVTTRLGFVIIFAGIVLIILRAANWIDAEWADIASTLAIVIGALAVAIDGEAADHKAK